MKSINAKRIAAVAASLLMGLAFAGQGGLTWNNVPIISNSGVPSVQIVVGSGAAPSDGVVAANIAAVLGNLAFTSQNVTPTASGLSGVSCVVTTPTCTLTNAQVWFGEQGFTGPTGSYSFQTLIGSLINQGVAFGAQLQTKTLQTSTSYAFPVVSGPNFATSLSPVESPFGVFGSVPAISGASPQTEGGLNFQNFRSSSFDNILQVSSTQLPSLLNNYGSNGETEYLWITGVPVYDQGSNNPVTGTPSFAVLGASGAYQVVFNKPIHEPYYQIGNAVNNAAITLLGLNWTILGYTQPTGTVGSNNAILGGSVQLAASLTPVQSVNVGANVSSNNFTVQLLDLGQPNVSGAVPASINVYYNGALVNKTVSVEPGSLTKFQTGTHSLYVKVNATFAGIYRYANYAKFKLYSNTMTLTSGQQFNQTNLGSANAYLLWTNATSTADQASDLQSILVVNRSSTTLLPGQAFTFFSPNMSAWKDTFVGDTVGANYDPLTFTPSIAQSTWLQNGALSGNTAGSDTSLKNISSLQSQPAQLLTVQSSISGALTAPGIPSGSGQTLTYDLTPYQLAENFNSIVVAGGATGNQGLPSNVVIQVNNGNANIINPTTPISVVVWGAAYAGGPVIQLGQAQVANLTTSAFVSNGVTSSAWNTIALPGNVFNVTDVYLTQPLPGVTVWVAPSADYANVADNAFATYSPVSTPQLLYTTGSKPYTQMTTGTVATYNQQQGTFINGGLTLVATSPVGGRTAQSYFTYSVNEYDVPAQTSNDVIKFGIYNATSGGAQSFHFQLNQSTTGTRNNITYVPSIGGAGVNGPLYFRTERGTEVAADNAAQLVLNVPKAVDTLQFVVAAGTTLVNKSTTTKTVGPVVVGGSVPGAVNVTVANIAANCTGGTAANTACSVTGLANVTVAPVFTTTPVSLNTATTPLVVLDSNANSAATLIVVGSKYVNSVAGQVFTQNPTLNSSFGPTSVVVQAFGTNRVLVAGYTANQTVSAGNQFINDLLQQAAMTQ